jgi:hypothetical protein
LVSHFQKLSEGFLRVTFPLNQFCWFSLPHNTPTCIYLCFFPLLSFLSPQVVCELLQESVYPKSLWPLWSHFQIYVLNPAFIMTNCSRTIHGSPSYPHNQAPMGIQDLA